MVSSDATSHLSKLFEERKELEDERMTISSAVWNLRGDHEPFMMMTIIWAVLLLQQCVNHPQIGAQEAIVRRLESELQEHMKSSAIDVSGLLRLVTIVA